MIERTKGILFAVMLGLMFPALVMCLVYNGKKELNKSVPETTVPPVREQIAVLLDDDSIAKMDMNDYLTCVVLCEMPAEFEYEALKAQAVVARTYANRRKFVEGKHGEAAVCTHSDCCQGYREVSEYKSAGGTDDDIEKIRNAVLETEGVVLTYQGQLIDATYFSCSGGMTEDAAAVWGADIPYLQATKSPGEEKATHYVDTVKFSVSDFLRMLSLDRKAFESNGIGEITYTEGGGVDRITIGGKVYKGTDIRKLLNLKSTAFLISNVGDTVVVTTKGFGHRVGMSQYGADAMALSGADYTQILKHYYIGVEITNQPDH